MNTLAMQKLEFTLKMAVLLWLLSCGRLERKGNEVVNTVKEKIADRKEKAVDKILPKFDSYAADTEFSKKRFNEFFGFWPTADVISLFCYGDWMGIDSKFMFAFNCDTSTKGRIVRELALSKVNETDNFGGGLYPQFPWWDEGKVSKLNPYRHKGQKEYYRYLWYDSLNSKAYYREFDL